MRSMTRLAWSERQQLCDELERLGPDAPTLCEGWATRDLAAHLFVRDARPDLSIGAYPIQTWGSEALKRKYLPAAARGDCILAFGLTEPEAGSNPREMQTTYAPTANGYLLSGVKYLISNGGIVSPRSTASWRGDRGSARRPSRAASA